MSARIGNDGFGRTEHLCLKVPSAVVVENYNIVLNTLHPDYGKVNLIDTLDFVPDQRLEEMIRKFR